MNKTVLRSAILQELRDELARQAAAAQLARDEAISEESQPENKWDTHSQEAAYLAEGQARQASEVGQSIEYYETMVLPAFGPSDAIALGALAQVAAGGENAWYFVGPRSGGLELDCEGRRILVITPQSPIGRLLVGRHVGDSVPAPGRAPGATLRITALE